jgi:hypothetical protein
MTAVGQTVELFRRGDWYHSKDTAAMPGPTGLRIALAPEIMLATDAKRVAATESLALDFDARVALLHRALDLFENGTVAIGGLGRQSASEFHDLLRQQAGIPAPLTQRWCAALRERLRKLVPVRADNALVLVALPANTFTCLEAVFEAVVSSGHVWIRPSRREALSAVRFVASLLGAGWPADRLGFYPSGQAALHTMIRLTDRKVVYGGPQVTAAFQAAPTLSLRGPGRACAIVDVSAPVEATAAWLLSLVASDSGRFCTNVCTIVCRGDPGPLAEALGARLDALDPADDQWPMASFPDSQLAEGIAALVTDRLSGSDRIVTRRPILLRGEEATYLAPTLVQLDDPGRDGVWHPLSGCELPFPFAAIFQADHSVAQGIEARAEFVYCSADPFGVQGVLR